MPCYSETPEEVERENKIAYDRATRVACAATKLLEKNGLLPKSGALRVWFVEHRKLDAQRAQARREQRERRKEEQLVKAYRQKLRRERALKR